MPLHRLPLLIALAALASPAMAVPAFLDAGPTQSLAFDIIRHGETIGSQRLVFTRHQDVTEVHIDISVKVTALSLVAYRFEQHGTEVWAGDRLETLSMESDDNGERHKVEARRIHATLRTTVDGKTTDYPEMPPASLWHALPLAAALVLDPVDGTPTPISTTDAGWETLGVRGKPTHVHHWVWSGGLNRDLWYDDKDTLVQIRVLGDDGSEITYVLR